MLSFFMALVTIFTRFKEKVDNNTAKYKDVKRQEKERLDRKIMNGESTGSKEAKDYIKKKDEEVDKKKRAVTRMLGLLTAVIAFFETLPLFFSLITWTMVLIIVMILVVIIFSFMAYLQGILNEDLLNCVDDMKEAEETSSSGVTSSGGILAWTEDELASKGKSLSDYYKNVYRLGISASYAHDVIGNKELDNSSAARMVIGTFVSETGGKFFKSGGNPNVFKVQVSDYANPRYAFLGLNVNTHLAGYNVYVTSAKASKIKKKYPAPSPLRRDGDFVPYAAAMSYAHKKNNYVSAERAGVDKALKNEAKKFGITKNVDAFVRDGMNFMANALYHAGSVPQDQRNALITFWAGIFEVSSSDDAGRDFSNYSLPTKSASFGEPEVRNSFFGSGGKNSTVDVTKLSGLGSTKIMLNGKTLNKPLLRYVYENTKHKSEIKSAVYAIQHMPNDRPMNASYGFVGLIAANTVEGIMASKMGISKDDSSSDEDKTKTKDEDNKTDKKTSKKEDKKEDKKKDKKTSFNTTTNNDTMKTNKHSRITMVSEPKVLRELTVQATAYTADCSGCSGRTAAGIDVSKKTPNLIAVDKSIIPLGTQVKLIYKGKELGIYYAGDTGGAIKGNIIDILVKDNKTALSWGRRTVTVQVLAGKGKLSYSNKGVIPLNGAESKSSFDLDEMDDDAKADKADTKASDSDDKTCKEDSDKSKKSDKGDDSDLSQIVAGNFKETPGKGQWKSSSGMTADKLVAGRVTALSRLKQYFGRSLQLSKGTAISKSYKDPYGVPFYLQGGGESYGSAIYGGSLNFNTYGCGMYAHSYALSALTGKLINPAETAVWMAAYTDYNLSNGMIPTDAMSLMYKQFGLKSKVFATNMNQRGMAEKVYNELKDSKNKLLVVRSHGSYYATGGDNKGTYNYRDISGSSNHYYVINGAVKKNGKIYFRIYTSAYPSQTMQLQPASRMEPTWQRQAILVWK